MAQPPHQHQHQHQQQHQQQHLQFHIEPLTRFAGIDAAIRRPKEFCCFSYDDDHQWRGDDSSLRYYYPPIVPANLSSGFDTFRQVDDTVDEHLDGLLEALVAHERREGKKLDTDIVTWRGMMTKIMIAPYSHLDSWEMNATHFQGTIYIEENHQQKLDSKSRQYTAPAARGAMSQDLMSFWGYKFEALSVLDKPWGQVSREQIERREDAPVSNYAQYCSIVRTGFGKTKMVIGGEVDAVETCKPVDKSLPIDWIELKTSAEIRTDRDQVKFERKLLKFWAQSFLLGVPKIVVGFRTQQGYLERLEELDVQGIPNKVMQQGKRLWDGQICINFAAALLEWLKTIIVGDGTWRICKREKQPFLEVFKVEESGSGRILSQSFLDWRDDGTRSGMHSQPAQAEISEDAYDSNHVSAAADKDRVHEIDPP